ncbi:MAG TPA: type V CRISPR-associated protein Cas12b [Verrucomicrobiae bacterium]
MNRIYFGKATAVEIPDGKDTWKKLDEGEFALWRHHQLFQDAVNYYTLALAAMAVGLKPDSAKEKAILEWRAEVLKSSVHAHRKAIGFDGPHKCLAGLLGVDEKEMDAEKAFTACVKALLKKSPATPEARAKALLQLLEEADQSDLNQFCVSRLPWLCTPHGKLDATPKNIAQQQETQMLAIIREIHEASGAQVAAVAEKLELGWFVTQMPKESMNGAKARSEAERLFKSASAKEKGLAAIADKFSNRLNQLGDKLKLPCLGRKPKGAYPLAVVFKLFPMPETLAAFKTNTESLRKKAEKLKDSPLEIGTDFVAEARTADDQPVFDYFTNRALIRENGREDRAVWFDFDLAAFIEAIKSPHRYLQDTLSREAAATKLREKLHAIEPDAGWLKWTSSEKAAEKKKSKESINDTEDETPSFTFTGDKRIVLLRRLITETLGYLAESENPESEKAEYTIQERTLRGWTKIREEWRKLAEKEKTTSEELWKVVKAEQGEHRDDFGSAPLYQKLKETEFQSIWREKGTQSNHADDPLQAWLQYKGLLFELKDKERPIRFTPAHAVHSPRYFIIPKVGKFGSDHEVGTLSFIAGIILESPPGLKPSLVRVHYSAPRLRRDGLRTNGETNLESVNWLQPMMKALGLPEQDIQDFSNCRILLQPRSEKNIQLTFPVEVIPDKLVAGIGKANLWARQFNVHPDGDNFYNATLRWPHEKQPAKPPTSWFDLLDKFSCVSIDLGQRDAGAFAVLQASAQKDFGKKPSRIIGETGEGAKKKSWRAALIASGMLRLSGEDRLEWRAPSKPELKRGEKGFDWREELFGERGRSATPEETQQCADLFAALEIEKGNFLSDDWKEMLSFPEQNRELLRAVRRTQSRISRLQRWCWFLADKEKQQMALKEIREASGLKEDGHPKLEEKTGKPLSGEAWISDIIKAYAKKDNDPRLATEIKGALHQHLNRISELVTVVANRVLPLRGRSWAWTEKNKNGESYYLLEMVEDKNHRPPIRGQRGLSFERIEQVEELRRRFQSLNQASRRYKTLGKFLSKEWDKKQVDASLKEEFPDPCPDLLEKLDRIKEQRVNQTAHMILAEALGVKLAKPPSNKTELRRERDQHGVYEKFREPTDFIVIEDLSRYRASQGRAPRENSRLMKWCHRAIRDKLKELCEPFGIPVLETPAAWSSRFCSRSGVAGFRAVEVHHKLKTESPWAWHLKRLKLNETDPVQHPLSEDARNESEQIKKLFDDLETLNQDVDGERPKWRTLYAPKTGGPIFIPICDRIAKPDHEKLQPAVIQSDINAAINIGLRAIADPRLWSIYPRLRTQREKDGTMLAREKRKYGEKAKVKIELPKEDKEVSATNRNPNFFADVSCMIPWGHAQLESEKQFSIVSGKALWSEIKNGQWKRVDEINQQRIQNWQNKADKIPM